MINTQDFIAQYQELDELCKDIHRAVIRCKGHYKGFTINGKDVVIHCAYDQSQDINYEKFPLKVVVKGFDAFLEWFNKQVEKSRKEYEVKIQQK